MKSPQGPPVHEVVCGVEFTPESAWPIAYLGAAWPLVADEFPKAANGPAALRVGESAGVHPRVWLWSEDERLLLQLRPEALHVNWRRVQDDDAYPRFAAVYTVLRRQLSTVEQSLGVRPVASAELSYINVIPVPDHRPETLSKWLPDLGWRTVDGLTPAGGFNWHVELRPAWSETATVRVAAQTGIRTSDEARVLRLELSVRGPCDAAQMDDWFAAAHESVLLAFEHLTSQSARSTWGLD